MKLLDILKTASANMLQSKLRTFLTIIAVFIGALTITLTNGIGSGVNSYIHDQVESIGANDLMFVSPKADNASVTSDAPKKYDPNQATKTGFGGQTVSALTDKDIAAIAGIDGIKDVTPQRPVSVTYAIGPNSEKYQASVMHYLTGTNLAMEAGSRPDNASPQYQISLLYGYAPYLGFSSDAAAVGQSVTIGITSADGQLTNIVATVVGALQKTIVEGGDSSQANSALYDKMYEVQSQGAPAASLGKYSLAVAHFDAAGGDAALKDLKSRLSDKGYTGQTVADTIGIVESVINGIVAVFDIFGAIALLAASFGVINTLLMAVQERTKEIGLMKAMGMRGGRIFMLFSVEAILLGFWGSLLGVLAAVGIGSVANRVASATFAKDFVGLQLLTFPWQSVLVIMLVIMLITFLAGTLPARRAARLNPIDALRYE